MGEVKNLRYIRNINMKSITHPHVDRLSYQIREIVEVAKHIQSLNPELDMTWENIGDPIVKGWRVPSFLKSLLKEEIEKETDAVFGYAHSRGLPEVRQWVADQAKALAPSATLDPEYVLFTSGLGSAIASLYQMLPHDARLLLPSPTYPTHASFESFHAGSDSVFYTLDPQNNWQPDIASIESQIDAHPDIRALLIINPNNPTGAVYSNETLEQIVAIAEKHQLMIISDEVYFRMVYGGEVHTQVTAIAAGRVPLVVMRGLSKDIPWPGGRCGWLEFHNVDVDSEFKSYADAVKQRILMEVCATRMPQQILPALYDHPDFSAWIDEYNAGLEANATAIATILGTSEYLQVNETKGAFYMMPLFKEGALKPGQTLPIENEQVRAFVEEKVSDPNMPLDQRFVYYLLAATGICVVPATGFYSPDYGFRLTTLERDPAKRDATYKRVVDAIDEYIASVE